ncbi:zinc protease [Devosia lucknowensis]|uniref:Zinc protease n=1 Tax=Devosia lucknowensis TaxID=1096929 RepID=A0A1Y6F5D3_9HYPH|nr:pitrilysin family protein [Devosia lucknowensis]SMQ70075.1 zinc protease [Devosia lucknowensis]
MLSQAILRISLAAFVAPALLIAVSLPARAEVAFREITTPAGITAWMVEDYTVPIITMAFAFDGGSAQDPDDKLGRANLMTTLFDEGAGDLDSDAFQTRQDEVGLEMSFSASLDAFSGVARMLVEQRDDATELLTLAVTEPRFDQPAIDRMRAQLVSRLVARSQDPNYAASRMWNEALFGDHPYGRATEGTEETLTAITADDLRALHDAIFARDNLTVGIVGALDEETAAALIDQVFGDLPQSPRLEDIPDAKMTFGQELAVDYPLPQTWINLAYPGIAERDDDFFAAYLMSEILAGGSLLSDLNVEVREKRGLSYGVSGGLTNFDHADAMLISTSTAPDQAAETIDVIRSTIARMVEDGPDPAQLERTKRYLIGAYPINQLRSSVSIAGSMVGQQLRDLPIDYVEQRTQKIEAVTAEDVKAVAQRIFGTDPSLMLVGPGAAPEDAAE